MQCYLKKTENFILEYLKSKYKNDDLNEIQKSGMIIQKSPSGIDSDFGTSVPLRLAKIIKRNPMDICWSNFKHHFSSKALSYSYNQSILGEFYNLYFDLMNYWNNKFPNKIYEACYENLIKNKDEEIKKLIKFCNLEWNPKCLDFHNNKKSVNTASLSQVRQPIYKSSVKSWEPFSKHLLELEKIIKK